MQGVEFCWSEKQTLWARAREGNTWYNRGYKYWAHEYQSPSQGPPARPGSDPEGEDLKQSLASQSRTLEASPRSWNQGLTSGAESKSYEQTLRPEKIGQIQLSLACPGSSDQRRTCLTPHLMHLTYLIPSKQTGRSRRERIWSEEQSFHKIPNLHAPIGQEQNW